jgi:hypothetical protein
MGTAHNLLGVDNDRRRLRARLDAPVHGRRQVGEWLSIPFFFLISVALSDPSHVHRIDDAVLLEETRSMMRRLARSSRELDLQRSPTRRQRVSSSAQCQPPLTECGGGALSRPPGAQDSAFPPWASLPRRSPLLSSARGASFGLPSPCPSAPQRSGPPLPHWESNPRHMPPPSLPSPSLRLPSRFATPTLPSPSFRHLSGFPSPSSTFFLTSAAGLTPNPLGLPGLLAVSLP